MGHFIKYASVSSDMDGNMRNVKMYVTVYRPHNKENFELKTINHYSFSVKNTMRFPSRNQDIKLLTKSSTTGVFF